VEVVGFLCFSLRFVDEGKEKGEGDGLPPEGTQRVAPLGVYREQRHLLTYNLDNASMQQAHCCTMRTAWRVGVARNDLMACNEISPQTLLYF
jgi:hypothetical protein